MKIPLTTTDRWNAHVRRWENCQECELCTQRHRIVLARGKLPCDVLFVGEAPGESEDVLGVPLIGPAGKILDAIAERGLPHHTEVIQEGVPNEDPDLVVPEVVRLVMDVRTACVNLVGCFPKEAKDAGTNEPSRQEIIACRPRLEEFISIASPGLIVAVGKLAETWMPKVRVPVVAIAHPAFILRLPLMQQAMASHKASVTIQTAWEELQEGKLVPDNREVQTYSGGYDAGDDKIPF